MCLVGENLPKLLLLATYQALSGFFMEYNAYLQTTHWKEIKTKFWNSKLRKNCHVCRSYKNINLHHRSYNHLWEERIAIDILPLCERCHKDVHFTHPILGKTPLDWKSLTTRMRRLRKYRRGYSKKRH